MNTSGSSLTCDLTQSDYYLHFDITELVNDERTSEDEFMIGSA